MKEGITGFVVNGTSREAVAQAATEILLNPELRRSMGEAGRRWIVEEWRWQIWSAKFLSLFK